MSRFRGRQHVGRIVARHAETEDVFEWYDISVEDYEDATLREVAAELEIDLETLLDDLEDALPADRDPEEEDDDDDLGPADDPAAPFVVAVEDPEEVIEDDSSDEILDFAEEDELLDEEGADEDEDDEDGDYALLA